MAATLPIQKKSVQGTGTGSASLAFTSNVTAGNTLVVCAVGNNSAVFATNACADNRGDTFTRHVSASSVSVGAVAILSAPNAAGGATTITVTGPGGSDFVSIAIFELPGLLVTTSFDVGTTNSGSGTAHATGTTGTTTQADEIAFVCDTHAGATSTPTVTAGWTLGAAGAGLETNSANMPLGTAWKILSATGTQTATFTWQNAAFVAGIATFKGAAVASDVPQPQMRMPMAIVAR